MLLPSVTLEKAMAPHSSTLARKIPWTEEPGSLVGLVGVAKSRTQLSDFTFTFHFHSLEKEMATHSSVLAWRILGTGKSGGLPSLRSHRVRHDWSNLAAAAENLLIGFATQNCCPVAKSFPTLCNPVDLRLLCPWLSPRVCSNSCHWVGNAI